MPMASPAVIRSCPFFTVELAIYRAAFPTFVFSGPFSRLSIPSHYLHSHNFAITLHAPCLILLLWSFFPFLDPLFFPALHPFLSSFTARTFAIVVCFFLHVRLFI